jgi:hypothetical protein
MINNDIHYIAMYSVCIKFVMHDLQGTHHSWVCNSWFANDSSYIMLRFVYHLCLLCQMPSLVLNWLSQPVQKLWKIFTLLLLYHFMFHRYVTKTKVAFSFKVCYNMACDNLKASYSHQASTCIYHVVRGMKFITSFMKISYLV